MRNLNVIAKNETDGFYYPGFISRPLDDDEISVRFYDIKPNRVAREEIIYVGGAIPCPDLKVGDYALVRVLCRTTRADYYVPAVIVVLPQGQVHETRFYTLQLYNGRIVNKLRRNIVKIGPGKFKAIFNYIAELRYGTVRRAVSIECLHSKWYLSPRMRRSSSTSSLVMLYPNRGNKANKINVLQLHDDIKEPWRCRSPKPPEPDREEDYYREHNSEEISISRNRIIQSESDLRQNKRVKNNRRQTYPRPRREEITVRSDVTSYSDDTFTERTEPRLSKKDRNRQLTDSCETLRSVDSISSVNDADIRRKQSSGDGKRRTRKKKHKKRNKDNEEYKKVEREKRKEKPRQPLENESKSSVHSSIVSSVVPKRVLQAGQEVLARWSDDGWYYRGMVVKEDRDDKYLIMDSTGYTELIMSEDILLDSDQEFCPIQPFDHVIALHPNYTFSYAPAIVKEDYSSCVTVVFYDKTLRKLPKSEVYKIGQLKYKRDVKSIVDCESGLRKSLVIARDDKTGFYEKCEIVCPEGVGQKFILKWPNGEMAIQAGNQVFLVENLNQSEQMMNWKYALAPVDDTMSTYLPADVIQTKPFRVKLFNQSRLTECCAHQCIWLTEAYFTNAVNFFNNINSDREE